MRVVPVQKECYYENNVIREHKKQGELFMGFLDKVFGTHSQREVKRIEPIVDKIEAMRDEMVALSDEALRDKTRQFKEIGRAHV